MPFKKLERKLNKNIEEETELVTKISLIKYLLVYVPLLFLMFTIASLIVSWAFKNVHFNWKQVLLQAVFFSIFFRIFHFVRKEWNNGWKNK